MSMRESRNISFNCERLQREEYRDFVQAQESLIQLDCARLENPRAAGLQPRNGSYL